MSSSAPTVPWLRLVHGFELRLRQSTVHVPLPAQRLLAFLALQDRPVHRRLASGTLWAEVDEQQASARLRSTLWRLPSPDGRRLVEVKDSRLRVSPEIGVDVRLAQDDARLDELSIAHLAGDILTDWMDDWVLVERERFRQLRLHRLEQLSVREERAGRFDLALQAALAAVAAEPLRESAHRRVMAVHLAEDNPSEALRQYDAVRRMLRDELGLAPSPATRSVVSQLLGRPLDRLDRLDQPDRRRQTG